MLVVEAEGAPRVGDLLEDIRRAMTTDPEAALSATQRLASLLTTSAPGDGRLARGGLAPWQRRKVEVYLDARLDRTVRLEDLAEQAGLSVSHFCRAFRETVGVSPHAYVVRMRVEAAKRLMLLSDDPLSQIACACGFADQSHLTKQFRRYVGDTPHAWRRWNKGGSRRRSVTEVVVRTESGAAYRHGSSLEQRASL